MEIFDTTQLALSAAMSGAAQRQNALADNIANVDTPGYRRKDVDFHQALQGAMAAGDRPAMDSMSFSPQEDASASPVRADGNTVDIDREAAAQASNGLEYEALSQVLKARDDILQTAMGVR
jgi:flagellar basal-body rod protein FlgB